MTSGLELLKAQQYEAALAQYLIEYDESPTDPNYANVGIAYFYISDYLHALDIFNKLVALHDEFSAYYAWIGLTHWMLDDRAEATRVWQEGINCGYADAAGGMHIPLLLLFASIEDPSKTEIHKTAIKWITKRAARSRAAYWPGPIGRFVLGELSKEELRTAAVEKPTWKTPAQVLQAEFYVGVMAKQRGDLDVFQSQMALCASTNGYPFQEEYFLAKRACQSSTV